MNIHSGAACWICLEGGPDEKGKPIVRDCACRGNDAGFAHTSCIIKYAQKKSKQAKNRNEFSIAWEKCPNCLQCYQNDLACHLGDVFVSYSKKTYGYPGNDLDDKTKVLEALRIRIQTRKNAMDQGGKGAESEVETIIHELLEMVDQAKNEHDMEGWVHMAPTSAKFLRYSEICAVYEAYGYYHLGYLCSSDIDIEISNYEKAREICTSVGSIGQAQLMADSIERARARSQIDAASILKNFKKVYDDCLNFFGENSEHTIKAGINYVSSLQSAYCSIEAERLVTKLTDTSRQVFGEDHKYTKQTLKLLNRIKRRIVFLGGPESPESLLLVDQYEALRYDNDGEMCIVMGPIKDRRQDRDEEGQELSVASEFIRPQIGRCPVICHGLINASHLNGKLGDVRSVLAVKGSSEGFRFVVHFEDESLKPAAVRPRNLRIAFELPSV